MVIPLVIALASPSKHLVAPEVVNELVATGAMFDGEKESLAKKIRDLGENDLALELLRSISGRTVSKEFLLLRDDGRVDQAITALSNRSPVPSVVFQAVRTGAQRDVDEAIKYALDKDAKAEFPFVSSDYGVDLDGKPVANPSNVDALIDVLVRYGRFESAGYVMNRALSKQEQASHLDAILRLAVMSKSDTAVDAFLRIGGDAIPLRKLMTAMRYWPDKRIVFACAKALREGPLWTGDGLDKPTFYSQLSSAIERIAYYGDDATAKTIALRYKSQLADMLAHYGVPGIGHPAYLMKIGADAVVRAAVARSEAMADRVARNVTTDLDAHVAYELYCQTRDLAIVAGERNVLPELVSKIRALPGMSNFDGTYFSAGPEDRQRIFLADLSHPSNSLPLNFSSQVRSTVDSLISDGQFDRAREVGKDAVKRVLAAKAKYGAIAIGEVLLRLDLRDELKSILSMAYEGESPLDDPSGFGFLYFLAVGDETGAANIAYQGSIRDWYWIQGVADNWSKVLDAPKSILLDVAGVNVFQRGLDTIAGSIGGSVRPEGLPENYIFLLRGVQDDPALVDAVLDAIAKHIDVTSSKDRGRAAVDILRACVPDSEKFAISIALQQRVVETVANALKGAARLP